MKQVEVESAVYYRLMYIEETNGSEEEKTHMLSANNINEAVNEAEGIIIDAGFGGFGLPKNIYLEQLINGDWKKIREI